MCLTQALIFVVPEDVLSQLPNMEGKVPDINYLVFELAQLVQVAISQLLGSVTVALQETAQSKVSTVKTVTLIIIKIPASLDSRESQHGEAHITACFQ